MERKLITKKFVESKGFTRMRGSGSIWRDNTGNLWLVCELCGYFQQKPLRFAINPDSRSINLVKWRCDFCPCVRETTLPAEPTFEAKKPIKVFDHVSNM